VKGIGDFNGDGYSDILWRDGSGQVSIWYLQHSAVIGRIDAGAAPISSGATPQDSFPSGTCITSGGSVSGICPWIRHRGCAA
jgi:hypothetical protein